MTKFPFILLVCIILVHSTEGKYCIILNYQGLLNSKIEVDVLIFQEFQLTFLAD